MISRAEPRGHADWTPTPQVKQRWPETGQLHRRLKLLLCSGSCRRRRVCRALAAACEGPEPPGGAAELASQHGRRRRCCCGEHLGGARALAVTLEGMYLSKGRSMATH
jgi:hypothetical protein